MIGTTVSHYRVLEKIGSGGMGDVYLAEDTKLKRQVALKFLPKPLTRDHEARERFEREAQATAALNHPNIVTIYEIGEHEGQVFIAMEYAAGKTLKEMISDSRTGDMTSPLPMGRIISIAIQIAEGLAAAHAKGIVHRDVKPQNILVDKENRVKILDFGLAKLKGVSQLTKEASTLGTVHYMSPEQTMGKEVDGRSDIWSLGVVLYELITGKLPFKGEYEQAVAYAILNEEPEPARASRPDLCPEWSHVLNCLLAKKPEDRYPNTGSLVNQLTLLERSTNRVPSVRSKGIPSTVNTGMADRRWKPYWIAVGAAVVVVFAVLGFFALKRSRGGPETSPPRKNSIAVMYFEDRSGEENFGKILAEMLISNLSRCKEIEVVSSEHLFNIQKKMRIVDSGTISRSMATDIARNARVGAMLLGSIDRIGATFNVNAQLCNVNTGSVIGPAQAKGYRVEDIYEMVNRLSDDTIRLMGISVPGDGPALRINDVTTHSYEAYRHYQKGQEQLRRFNFRGAGEELREAIRIDDTFAMAHVYLAFSENVFKIWDPFSDLSRARSSMRLAKQSESGISSRERDLLHTVDAMINRDFTSLKSVLEEVTGKNPDDHTSRWLLGFYFSRTGNGQAAIQSLEKLIETDPDSANGHLVLAYTHSRMNEHEKAISAIKKYMALLPDVQNSYDSACDIYLRSGMYDQAYRVCDEALRVNPDWTRFIHRQSYIHLIRGESDRAREKNRLLTEIRPGSTWSRVNDLGCFALHEGRHHQAESGFKSAIRMTREQKLAGDEMEERLVLGRFQGERRIFKDAIEQFSEVKKLSVQAQSDSCNTWLIRADFYWGLAALADGRFDECRAAAERISEFIRTNRCDEILMGFHHLLLAEIDIQTGHAAKASFRFNQICPFIKTSFPRCRLLAAKIFESQGEVERARRACDDLFDDWETTFPGQGGDFFDYWQIRSTMKYRIARLYERSGDRTRAAEYYQLAVDQWKNADEDMPEYIDAKARLARLQKGK